MMALDPRIPLGVNPLQVQSPLNALARVAQVQNAMQGNALARMQMQQMQEAALQQARDRAKAEADAAARAAALQSLPRPGGDDPQAVATWRAAQAGLIPVADALKMLAPKERKLTTVAPGSALVDEGTGAPVFTAPERAAAPTDLGKMIAEMNALPPNDPRRALYSQAIRKATTHAPGVSVSYGAPVAGVDAEGKPVFFSPPKDPTKQAPVILPGVAPPKSEKAEKSMTEAQAKATAFRSQMDSAERELATTPIDQTSLAKQLEVGLSSGITNLATGSTAQRARQAQEQWAEAYLRFKTGAASTEAEVKRNIATFFPQPGDKPEVIQQKARMRKQAADDVGFAATGKPAAAAVSGLPSASDIDAELRRRGVK